MNISFDPQGRPPQGPLARIAAVIVGLLLLAAGFMFSLVVFAVLAVVGLVLGVYFWWKTRAIRKMMREQAADPLRAQPPVPPPAATGSGGQVIEGEAVRVPEEHPRLPE
jgi:membrane protein implicated in regulation of membrane protease activity